MQTRTQHLLETIETMRFFGSLGSPCDADATFVMSWAEAAVANRSEQWRWMKMEARNVLTKTLFYNCPERYMAWNDLVDEILPSVDLVAARLAGVIPVGRKDRSLLEASLSWTLLAICMEKEFEDLTANPFYQEIWKWYQRGHLPCGWDGPPDPEGDFENTMASGKLIVF